LIVTHELYTQSYSGVGKGGGGEGGGGGVGRGNTNSIGKRLDRGACLSPLPHKMRKCKKRMQNLTFHAYCSENVVFG